MEMKMRGTFLLVVATFVCLSPAFAAGTGRTRVVMVTDVAGLGDQGFNDAAWAGVQRAAAEFGVKADIIQSREQADYLSNLATAAERADVVVAVGFIIADSVKRAAPKYPGTYFVQIEGAAGEAPNVLSFDFKSEEGGFLAGVVAALYTETGKVGAVSGMAIPPVRAYEAGYLSGVKAVNESTGGRTEAIILSAGSFDDPVKGKSLAENLIGRGCDVLFRIAGNTGVGVWEAVRAREGVRIIWEDIDRDSSAPGKILASALKRVDNAVFKGIKMAVEGEWESGHRVLAYADGGIGLSAMEHSRELFTADELAMIERAKALLAAGEISIPRDPDAVDEWDAPRLGAAR